MYYFLDVVKELYHRKDLGSKVDNANEAYVSLFERMLSEVLLLQRSKFNVRKKLSICSLHEKIITICIEISYFTFFLAILIPSWIRKVKLML